ncbi:MAG: thiolase family protein [Oscillospiraceae bacterium]|nr:thiolase family protein [Oscillospiraceae bacterium]
MREAVIAAYGRSACCRARKGGFAGTHPLDYAAATLKGVLNKLPQLDPERIDDVITGCAFPLNEMNLNPSRLIANRAQLPESVPAQTILRFCSSGLQSIATAANAIMAGQYDCAVAGGVESMSKCFVPHPPEYQNEWITNNYEGGYMSMGETAERLAEKYGISRAEMELFALESHTKAAAARKNGKFKNSIIPVVNAEGRIIDSDEGILADEDGNLKTDPEKMAGLKPCFRENGIVTAATSSPTTDAAAYAVLMSSETARELGIEPIAKFIGFSVAGCDATLMGMGPVYAIPKVMKLTGMSLSDMDVIELNEAFASQFLVCVRELGLDRSIVNPYGGALALGHPLGATGAVLTAKAVDYLLDNGGRRGLVSMCIGGGMGAAGIFELCG